MPTDTPQPEECPTAQVFALVDQTCGKSQVEGWCPEHELGTPPRPLTDLEQNRRHNEFLQARRVFEAAVLAYHDHELMRVNAVLHDAGIDYPQGARGVADLAAQRDTRGEALIEKIEELTERWKRDEGIAIPGPLSDGRTMVGEIIKLIREDDERYD